MEESQNIRSPCVSRCMLDHHDICEGCFRSVKEIKKWHKLSPSQKLIVWQNTKIRKQAAAHDN